MGHGRGQRTTLIFYTWNFNCTCIPCSLWPTKNMYGLSISQAVLLTTPPQGRNLRNQPKGLTWSPNDQTIMRLSSSSLLLRALPLGTNFKHKRLFMVLWPQSPANFKGAILSNIIPCTTSHSACPWCCFSYYCLVNSFLTTFLFLFLLMLGWLVINF